MEPRQAVARGDAGLMENDPRAVGQGHPYGSGVLGGDQLLRADPLLDVPGCARGEIPEEEGIGDRTATHG
jgi:hypothetical protein